MSVAFGVAAQFLERLRHVGGLGLFAGIAPRERKIVLEHHRHFVDVLAHPFKLGVVADKGKLELEAGEYGAQIV